MKLAELKQMNPINLGLWIGPTGDIIKTGRHSHTVIENPTKFGVSSEFVKNLYDKHGENYNQEGNAREELITLVLQRGWIRVRNYRNYWSVTLWSLTPKTKQILKNWVHTFTSNNTMGTYVDLKILEIKSDRLQTVEPPDILNDRLDESHGDEAMTLEFLKESTIQEQPDLEMINEVKLSRVYNHFTSNKPVGIITAFRGERTMKDNISANQQLASSLRNAGFGFVWVDGAWVENQGTDKESHEEETSIMVVGNEGDDDKMFTLLKSESRKYEQDGFLFKSSDGPAGVYDSSGNEIMSFNRINIDKLSSVYTRLRQGSHKGRSFFFGSERPMKGFMSRLMEI